MKRNAISSVLIALLFGLHVQNATAATPDGEAVRQMADILIKLNHYPTAPEKDALKMLMEDASNPEHVRTLAAALRNIEHYATAGDKERLQHIIADDAASANLRALARIMLGLSHKPTAADKEELSRMMGKRY